MTVLKDLETVASAMTASMALSVILVCPAAKPVKRANHARAARTNVISA